MEKTSSIMQPDNTKRIWERKQEHTEVYNLHELTKEGTSKGTQPLGGNIQLWLGTKKIERHCKSLNRYSISRWTDGHTMIIPIGIVSLLITARKKIIWKGLDFWNTLSKTIGTTCINPKPFGDTITRQSARAVYSSPMIVFWRAIIWTMRYYSLYTTFWKPPTTPPFYELMNQVLKRLFQCRDDMEYQFSEEAFCRELRSLQLRISFWRNIMLDNREDNRTLHSSSL